MATATITVTGNVGKEPAMRTTGEGKTFWTFSLASTPRTRNKTTNEWADGETLWFTVSTFGSAEGLTVGSQLLVTGTLVKKTYEKDGESREGLYINAETVAIVPKKQDLNDYFKTPAATPATPITNITDLAIDAPF
jgi:single-strand DNA-binding protein